YDDRNKKKVYDELKKEFRKDRAKVTLLPMSEFGLVQITRQRVRENVVRSITEQCPLCGGSGIVESSTNILTRIERWIKRFKLDKSKPSGKLLLKVHPMVYKTLREGTISNITRMSFRYLLRITLEEDASLAFQEFRFISVKTNEDVTARYS
ncbi:MAG TPA: ribonuclease E/G, partial [Ignavibacteria bacterium]|nr:ribonuclease E/G [Ignavibacteria bacterium]